MVKERVLRERRSNTPQLICYEAPTSTTKQFKPAKKAGKGQVVLLKLGLRAQRVALRGHRTINI